MAMLPAGEIWNPVIDRVAEHARTRASLISPIGGYPVSGWTYGG